MRGLILLVGVLAALAGPAAAACRVAPGSDDLLIRAVLLRDAGPPRLGELAVEDGRITCVGPRCAAPKGATRLDCPDAVLSPGFINLHEHLPFGHVAPTPDDGVRYGQRHDWRKGLRGRPAKESFDADSSPDLLAWAELRHVLTGTTSLAGGGMAPGLARNLDAPAGLEGLEVRPVLNLVFPLDDGAGIQRLGDCDYGPRAMTRPPPPAQVVVAHVGEGVDDTARNEFACLSRKDFDTTPAAGGGGISADVIGPGFTLVHAVALTPEMLASVGRRGAAIVWSPRSNLSLYGGTLDVEAARRAGVTLALGTDWLPSGSISMGREAACALAADPALSARDVWRMMTLGAAEAAHMQGRVGVLREGRVADLVLVSRRSADPYRDVALGRPGDIRLVVRGGVRLAGAPSLMPQGREGCERVALDGVGPRTLCIAGETGRSYAALQATMQARGVWPAVFPGRPPVEPPCLRR